MEVYELRIARLRGQAMVAAVRWQLFLFPEVRDVVPSVRPETVAVLYEGGHPEPDAWCGALRQAGYQVKPAAFPQPTGTAA